MEPLKVIMGLILVKKYVFLYFGANLTENDPRTPIFLFHFWNPDNFSNLYVKFEENLMDFKNAITTLVFDKHKFSWFPPSLLHK